MKLIAPKANIRYERFGNYEYTRIQVVQVMKFLNKEKKINKSEEVHSIVVLISTKIEFIFELKNSIINYS